MKGTMKTLIFAILFLASTNAYAGISVCFDGNGAVTQMSLSSPPQEGCDYYDVGNGINQAQDDLIREIIKTVPQRYIKKVNGFPFEMSPAEKVAVDDAWAAQIQADTLSASRSGAKDFVDQLSPEGVRLRASLLVILDRFNTVTGRINAVESCIEGAGTLAAAKTCLAGLEAIPDATSAQMKTAIKSQIDNGSAD